MGMDEVVQVGQITHYFPKIGVGVIELSEPLSVGDTILVKGPTTDFEQTVDSMQIDRKNIPRAEAKQAIGLKLAQPVKEKDMVTRRAKE